MYSLQGTCLVAGQPHLSSSGLSAGNGVCALPHVGAVIVLGW